jgi:MerR family transcriptional regulator, light-induced transcriptional regulator
MQTFSIRDIENLSGIKAHTLRVWEQRYGLIMPARKESRHREYTNEDLKHILRVSYLYHHGYKISRIAVMSPEEINTLSLDYNQHTSFEVFINQFIEAALDFDEDRFEEVFDSLILHLGFEKAFIHVVYPFLQKLGMLWMTGNILPAQEHFSSHIIRKKIILAIDALTMVSDKQAERIILFSPSGEYHEIPLLLIHYLLKKSGNPIVFFGIDISIEELKLFVAGNSSCILYFHLVTNFTDMHPEAYLEMLCSCFPGKKIFASGPVFKKDTGYPDQVKIFHSLNDLRGIRQGLQ